MSDVWNAISAVSAAVGALVVVVAAVYARSQVTEARRSREVSLLMNIYERYNDEALRAFRHRLSRGPLQDADTLSDADTLLLYRNLDLMEFLAISVERDLLDFEAVRSIFPYAPLRMWAAAEKYLGLTATDSNLTARHLARLAQRYQAIATTPAAVQAGVASPSTVTS